MPKSNGTGSSTWIDPDDAPELTEAFFDGADIWQGETLLRSGRQNSNLVQLDQDVIDRLLASGPDWQVRANAVLRHWLDLNSGSQVP